MLSMSWLFDFSQPEGKKGATGSLDNLETHTRKITLSVTGSTETSDKTLVVLINEGHTTISWDVGGNSLVVLLKLDSHALSNSGVWLLSLNGNLLDNNTSGVRCLLEWFLPLGT